MARYRILIAGGGLGGLTAASCLAKAGHEVEIYEQAPRLFEVGAGIQISANAMHVLRHLGLADLVMKAGVRPAAYVFRLHDTGEIIQRFSLSDEHERLHGAPYTQLHRADLQDMLAATVQSLAPGAIHLGRKVLGYTESDAGVKVWFADGAVEHCDMLIGADGLKSMIRTQMMGEVQAIYTGDAAWRILIPIERLPPKILDKVMSVFVGPGGHAICYYLRGGAVLNFVGIVETAEPSEDSWTLKFPWGDLKRAYAGWHQTIQAIIDAADRDQCYRWSLYNLPSIKNWSSERATLLGDAAHPTLPYLAQGAAMAIEDGAVLTRALSKMPTIPAALKLYQSSRMDRTARIVRQSNENRKLFHLPSTEEIRAAFAQRDQGADRNQWLYSYNPLTAELA